ncbi:MAG: hypothetical protein LIO43_02600 [Clostridiales bacterium]|nr:hypothetical protein [Clostridiales bacterium]
MPVVFGAEKSGLKYYTARFSQASQIPKNHPFKRIFIPIWSSDESFAANNAGVEIPRGLFGMEKPLKARLSQLKKLGVKKALCGNLGAYKTALDMGFKAYGDFGLNIFNSVSAGMINSPILSFELTVESTNKISAPDTGVIVYGRLPLMLARNCPVKNNIGCDKCRKKRNAYRQKRNRISS